MAGRFEIVLLHGLAGCLLIFAMTGCGTTLVTSPSQILVAADPQSCVEVVGASPAAGANLVVSECANGKRSQEWLFTRVGGTPYQTVMNQNSGMCLAVAANPNNQGFAGAVVQAACNNADPDVLWTIKAGQAGNGDAGFVFVNHATGQCLDLPTAAANASSPLPLQQNSCATNDTAQVWDVNFVLAGNTP